MSSVACSAVNSMKGTTGSLVKKVASVSSFSIVRLTAHLQRAQAFRRDVPERCGERDRGDAGRRKSPRRDDAVAEFRGYAFEGAAVVLLVCQALVQSGRIFLLSLEL